MFPPVLDQPDGSRPQESDPPKTPPTPVFAHPDRATCYFGARAGATALFVAIALRAPAGLGALQIASNTVKIPPEDCQALVGDPDD
jgi:hypothetical protein